MRRPALDEHIFEEWQAITDLLASLCAVPAALLMRRNPSTMEVLSTSRNSDSPYRAHETAPLEGRLFCETVIASQKPLHVPNALEDPQWDHNPDLELGLLSYFGVPINWPDGAPFGTLCILDRKEKYASTVEQHAILRFASLCEKMLALASSNLTLETHNLRLQTLERSLLHQIATDTLTGTKSRSHFFEVCRQACAGSERNARSMSILILDIDRFKAVNDTYGHAMGDLALIDFSQAISSVLRAESTFARIGGEEFAILLPEADAPDAAMVAQRVLATVSSLRIPYEASSFSLTVSIGIATSPNGTIPMETLMLSADAALYTAKSTGRNRIATHTDPG